MLKLDRIVKVYPSAGQEVTALRGVSLQFRRNEFVAVLGHSGCGKTTLLNIIGGLDQYTSGDLVINGRSTREFRDRDWDAYRNHSIGFVFQSYNLIPHQSVLSNVELALTLSGVGKAERRRRAEEALEKVGLRDQMKKRPNQLSGGQMQRVAIARALVNDPEILLADEPTGALDSETSVQVMDLLAEIAREKLVIMVTHNPELAQQYATRIVRLKDGQVVDDSDPAGEEEALPPAPPERRQKKRSMSFATAFSLSLNNLMTKKGRTVLTSFAGSIGIIGIALILSLSSGIDRYIDQVQEDTLSSYPVIIQGESVDMSSMMTALMGAQSGGERREDDRVYASTVMYDMINSMTSAEVQTNDLRAFKEYLDQGGGGIRDLAAIQYSYDANFDIYTRDEDGKIVKSDVTTLLQDAMTTMYGGDYSSYFSSMGSMYEQMDVWEELLPGEGEASVSPLLEEQYDVLYGRWPQAYDEVILFVDPDNRLSDLMLYALGLLSSQNMTDSLNEAMEGRQLEVEERSWSYEELCGRSFKLLLPAEYYQYDQKTGTYTDMSATEAGLDFLFNSDENGVRLKVVGVARASEEASSAMVQGAIGYTSALTDYAIRRAEETEVIRRQLEDPETDVITGLPFPTGEETEPTGGEKEQAVKEYLAGCAVLEKAEAYTAAMGQPGQDYVELAVQQQMEGLTRERIQEMIVSQYAGEMGVEESTVASYIAEMDDETLFARVEEAIAQQVREQYAAAVSARLGAMSAEELARALDLTVGGEAAALSAAGLEPFTEEQYAYLYDNVLPPTVSDSTFQENLDRLGYVDLARPDAVKLYASTFADKDLLAERIAEYNDSVDHEEQKITYTDYVALLMSSITNIISGISYLLIAFVSISLVVSSIMIGIITYISVLERTKEIGILRAVGASKRDVGRVFNAETLIVGLGAGLLGIGVTVLLLLPINAILLHFTGLVGLKAALPWQGAAALVAISALLTILAGLIPSRVAARKDPVTALRTE